MFSYFRVPSYICFSLFWDTSNDTFKEHDYIMKFLKLCITEYNIIWLSLLNDYFSGSKIVLQFVLLHHPEYVISWSSLCCIIANLFVYSMVGITLLFH